MFPCSLMLIFQPITWQLPWYTEMVKTTCWSLRWALEQLISVTLSLAVGSAGIFPHNRLPWTTFTPGGGGVWNLKTVCSSQHTRCVEYHTKHYFVRLCVLRKYRCCVHHSGSSAEFEAGSRWCHVADATARKPFCGGSCEDVLGAGSAGWSWWSNREEQWKAQPQPDCHSLH